LRPKQSDFVKPLF